MTLDENTRWASSNYSPLPYESTFSVLSWFAWRNVLRTPEVLRLFACRRHCARRTSFLNPSWVDTIKLAKVTGWDYSSCEERRTLEELAGVTDNWFSERVTYCPLCLEGGYHSFWFQFIPLKRCPLHACQLVQNCQSCGKLAPGYACSTPLFRAPYVCAYCAGPLCGATPSLRHHEEFRAQRDAIAASFAALNTWCSPGSGKFELAKRICTGIDGEPRWSDRYRQRELLRNVVNQVTPLPAEYDDSQGQTTVLMWRVARLSTGIVMAPSGRIGWKQRTQPAMAVYRATLRNLEQWIATVHRAISPFTLRYSLFTDATAGMSQSEVCALRIFRLTLEGSYCWSCDSRKAQLTDVPPIEAHVHEGRTLRLEWRALFLGLYVAILHMVRRKGAKLLEQEGLPVALGVLVPRSVIADGDTSMKAVFFPSVPGLPIRPFKDFAASSTKCKKW